MGVLFVLLISAMIWTEVIAELMMNKILQDSEKPIEMIAYEQLHAIHDAHSSGTYDKLKDDLETDAINELWQTDYGTLATRFQEFDSLAKRFDAIYKESHELTLEGFWNEDALTDLTDEEWHTYSDFLDKHTDFLPDLLKLLEQDLPVFPTDLSDSYAPPHLRQIRPMTYILVAAAAIEAHRNNPELVRDYSLAIFQLARTLSYEPGLIAFLLREGRERTAIENVWKSFPPGTIPARYSQEFINLARERNNEPRGIIFLIYEKYTLDAILIAPYKSGPRYINGLIGFSLMRSPSRAEKALAYTLSLYVCSPLSAPWRHKEFKSYVELSNELYEISKQPHYASREKRKRLNDEIDALPIYTIYSQIFLSVMSGYCESYAELEARYDLLWMGLTLEQHFVEEGEYPAQLEDVISDAPLDPFSGKPYVYKLQADSFLLYSIGKNGKDDNGVQNGRDLDLVWRRAY